MANRAARREALLDLLRVEGKDPGALVHDASVEDLEWLDHSIDWQLLSLAQKEEEPPRTPDEAEHLRQFKMKCEQMQMQVRDILHDKRTAERRGAVLWGIVDRTFFIVLAALLGWALARYFPGGGA